MSEYIYVLSDPRTLEARYVGWTYNPSRRLTNHLSLARTDDQSHRSRWLRTLLRDGLRPRMDILEVDPVGGWRAAEPEWIDYLRTLGCDLTNLTRGGEGFTGSQTEAHKAKISAALKGITRSPATRARMSAAQRGRTVSDETRAKISASKTGKPHKQAPHSLVTKLRISAARNTSGYIGVSLHKATGKWRAYGPVVNGHVANLGLFTDLVEAGRIAAAFRRDTLS